MISKKHSEIIIIGAGIIGMLSAHLLSRSGIKVTLIEQGYAGKESSWAGGGIISPLYPWRYTEPVTALAKWGQEHYLELFNKIKNISHIDPQFIQSGLLYLDIDNELEEAQQWMNQFSYPFQNLHHSALTEIEPHLNSNYQQGWFTDSIYQVRNPRLVQAMQKLMYMSENIALYENTRMQKLIIDNQIVRGIKTNQGDFYADKVIIAGGAWSANLLKQMSAIPKIAPVKGQMIVFKTEPGLIKRITLSKGRYIIPRIDGRVLLGSTLELKDFDKSTDDETLNELKSEAYRILPVLKNYPVEKQWAGLRPGSIDGVPYIGQYPQVKNLFINAGHFRNGVVIGYASCELLKNIIVDEKPILDPSPYQLDSIRMSGQDTTIELDGAI